MKSKNNEGIILFSNEIFIYEKINNEYELFEEIELKDQNYLENLNLYIKKLKKLDLTIYIKNYHFREITLQILKSEVHEKDIEEYVNEYLKEDLNEENLNNYFIKFFKTQDEEYKIFVLDSEFIEEIIEFIIENKLKIKNIFIKGESDFLVDDYDKIIKKVPIKNLNFLIFYLFLIFISFSGIKLYTHIIKKDVEEKNNIIISKNETIDTLKSKQKNIESELNNLKEKINTNINNKKYFKNSILKIIKLTPNEITLKYIYYEKEKLIIEGYSKNKDQIFSFLETLEKNQNTDKVKYDYITNENNHYNFSFELKVL